VSNLPTTNYFRLLQREGESVRDRDFTQKNVQFLDCRHVAWLYVVVRLALTTTWHHCTSRLEASSFASNKFVRDFVLFAEHVLYACSDTYGGMARAGKWNPTCSHTSSQRAFPYEQTASVRLVRVSVFSFYPLPKAPQVLFSIIWSKNSLFDSCSELCLWSDRCKLQGDFNFRLRVDILVDERIDN
jgi:hypothetical protein